MTPYRFVTMNVTGFKRWHLVQQVVMPPAPMGPWGWRGGPWGPGWGWLWLVQPWPGTGANHRNRVAYA